jgi:hypothetical protein
MNNLSTLGPFYVAANYLPDHSYLWLLCGIVWDCVDLFVWTGGGEQHKFSFS